VPVPVCGVSLKQSEDEGLTPEELETVTRWRRMIAQVATEKD